MHRISGVAAEGIQNPWYWLEEEEAPLSVEGRGERAGERDVIGMNQL